jgi:putative ABC transport system substrate-binding protein
MRRREVITLLGGAGASSLLRPRAAHAQQPALPTIGILYSGLTAQSAQLVAGFHQGLKEAGYVEGQNVAIEYRSAEGRFDLLPALAADLVRRQVAVLAALGGDASALAAKATTTAIPIVFIAGTDPVKLGLVSSLNKPGGNLTGVALLSSPLLAKQLQLLGELVPSAGTIALLVNPNNSNTDVRTKEMQEAAHAVGRQLFVATASSESELASAFATIQQQAGALVIPADPSFTSRRDQLVALSARYTLPTCYPFREYAIAGGLMSYGTSLTDAYRLGGVNTGRILKGEKAADLPVEQVVKVEFVINLKTAKTLGLTFPLALLGRADEVIE